MHTILFHAAELFHPLSWTVKEMDIPVTYTSIFQSKQLINNY